MRCVNTQNGSIYIFKCITWKCWFIYVYILKFTCYCNYFTEHVWTTAFIFVTSFISQETEGLYLIIRENNKLWFFSPYFSPILKAKHNPLKYSNKRLCIYAYAFQATWRDRGNYRFVELQTHYSELLLHTYICICIYMYSATATPTDQGPVLLTLLRHVAIILANGSADVLLTFLRHVARILAALPLAKILATCRNNVSNTGPSAYPPPPGCRHDNPSGTK